MEQEARTLGNVNISGLLLQTEGLGEHLKTNTVTRHEACPPKSLVKILS